MPNDLQPSALIGGNSHMFALGALRGYSGPVAPVSVERGGEHVQFMMPSGPRDAAYWDAFVEASRGRYVFVTWGGNNHFASFLFKPRDMFDFLIDTVPQGSEVMPDATLVPKRLVKSYFADSHSGLAPILRRMKEAGALGVAVVGGPPPREDLSSFATVVRTLDVWRQAAKNAGVDIDAAELMPSPILLKLWAVLQELLEEAAISAGAQFIPSPAECRTPLGYLREEYVIRQDFTHANDAYGAIALKAPLRSYFQ